MRNRHLTVPKLLALAVMGIALLMGAGASAQTEEPSVMRETEACLDCHDGQDVSLMGSPHQVLTNDGTGDTRVSCTSCHVGDVGHMEDDPELFPMFMPSSETFAATSKICGQCHETVHQENAVTLSLHANAKVGCLECHQMHGSKVDGQLKQAQPQLCYTCHTEIEGQFGKPYRHAVAEGIIDCVDCHLMADDEMAQLERFGKNAACMKCHAEFQGPFPYDHQAAVDYSTEEGGCINCHDPHGSYLPRMLIQPYEGPNFQLCSQCHVVPQHKYNTQHGSTFAGVSCSECHVDIHGSYTSQYYYPPTMAAEGCFAAGCHSQ